MPHELAIPEQSDAQKRLKRTLEKLRVEKAQVASDEVRDSTDPFDIQARAAALPEGVTPFQATGTIRDPLGSLGAIPTAFEAVAETGLAGFQAIAEGPRLPVGLPVGPTEESRERSRESRAEIGAALTGERPIGETITSLARRQRERPIAEQIAAGMTFDILNLAPGLGFAPDIIRGVRGIERLGGETFEALARTGARQLTPEVAPVVVELGTPPLPSGETIVPFSRKVFRAEGVGTRGRPSKSFAFERSMAAPEGFRGAPENIIEETVTLQRPLRVQGLQGDLLDVWAKAGDTEAARILAIADEAGVPPVGWFREADTYIARKAGSLGHDGIVYEAGVRAEVAVIDDALITQTVGGVTPPTIPPSIFPESVPLPPSNKDLVSRVSKSIREAAPSIEETELLVAKERGRRFGAIEETLAGPTGPETRARAAAEAAGELPVAEFEPPASLFSNEEFEQLHSMVQTTFQTSAPEWLTANRAFTKLFTHGQLPNRSELEILERVFGEEFSKAILSKRPKVQQQWDTFLKAWNIPRALMASMDLSASLRQGALMLPEGHPYREAFVTQWKALRSQDNVDALYDYIRTDAMFDVSQRSGLDLTLPSPARGISGLEEPFIGAELAERIPIVGRVVKLSNRAYAAFLNKVRFEVFKREATELIRMGATPTQLKELARNINVMTGRANIPVGQRLQGILNGMFFSPKFVLSRIQVPTLLIRQVVSGGFTSPAGRRLTKMVAKDTLGYFFGVNAMLAAGDAAGLFEVEWDPRSSDWGKMRFGTVRIDPWAGLQQPMRLVAQIVSGQTKQISTGRIRDVSIRDALSIFIESKAHPSLGALLDLREGELFGGRELTIPNFLEGFTPLFFQDIKEVYEASGPRAAAGIAPLGFFGVSVYNIPSKYGTGVAELDDELHRLDILVGEVGNTINNIELTKPQQEQYKGLAAQFIAEALPQLFAAPEYIAADDTVQEKATRRVINRARARARGVVLQQIRQERVPTTPRPTAIPPTDTGDAAQRFLDNIRQPTPTGTR